MNTTYYFVHIMYFVPRGRYFKKGYIPAITTFLKPSLLKSIVSFSLLQERIVFILQYDFVLINIFHNTVQLYDKRSLSFEIVKEGQRYRKKETLVH